MEEVLRESAEDIAPTNEHVHSLVIFPILFDVSSADDLTTLNSQSVRTISTSNGAGTDPAADVPDNHEGIEVVRAEMSFYSTPHTEEFKRPVYDTLKRIQDSCHDDFVARCSGANSLRRGDNQLKQRHLSAIISEMENRRDRGGIIRDSAIKALFVSPPPIDMHGAREDQGSQYGKPVPGTGPEKGSRPPEKGSRTPPGSNSGGPQSPEIPSTGRGSWGAGFNDGDSDSDNEEDGHDHDHHGHDHRGHDHHDHDHHDHHHHHQIEEDVWFSGSLGFGQDGDMCLYENFPKVSNQCQFAVRDLHALRSTYWQQEVNSREGPPMGHPCFLFVLFSAAFLFILVFFNLKTRKMRKLNRAVMDAIESNPQLRAQGTSYP
jgi:hypothetical protein